MFYVEIDKVTPCLIDTSIIESVKSMPQPVPFSQLPNVKMDFRGILRYAKERGLDSNELSMEEREKYCHKIING